MPDGCALTTPFARAAAALATEFAIATGREMSARTARRIAIRTIFALREPSNAMFAAFGGVSRDEWQAAIATILADA